MKKLIALLVLLIFSLGSDLSSGQPVIHGPVIQGMGFEPRNKKRVDIVIQEIHIDHYEITEDNTKYLVKFVVVVWDNKKYTLELDRIEIK